MHIHWIANCVARHTLSGGDRIMVECLRRWRRQHRITVYGWEGTASLIHEHQLSGIEHVLWPSERYEWLRLPGLFAAQTLIGCARARRLVLPSDESHLIVSSSDFLTDSLPALTLKRRHPQVPWVAAFYLFAPPLRDWASGKPGPGLLFTLYRPVQQWVLHRLLREADMILVTGEEDRQRMVDLGRSPSSVFAVRGGVDLSIPRSVPEASEKRFDAVFVGRFHPQKGVRELLQIWKKLTERRPQARLALIGCGPLEAQLRSLVQQLALQNNVIFMGFMDGVEKYRIIKASRVVVHPAIYDSGGMAPAEALACGLPGVAFDLNSLRSYYPHGFLKAPLGNHQEFANQILRLLTHKGLYAEMSAKAASAGAEWDWDLRANQAWEAIQRHLGAAP